MDDSIGKYIQKWLRFKNISNQQGGDAVGLSKSAFEKVLTKDDILVSRLLKLTSLANENLLEYYYDKEPLKSFREKEISAWTDKIDTLNRELASEGKLLEKNDEIISLQRKYIAELEDKLKRFEGR